jgi:hypothetical protein
MTLLHERKNADVEVSLYLDDFYKTLEVWCLSNDGVFGIECGKDGKLAMQAFEHPFAYRDHDIMYEVARPIGTI